MEFYKEELKKSLEDTIEGLEKHSQDAIALDLFYTAVKNSKSLEEYVIPFVADKIESAIFSIEFNLEQKEKLGLDTDVKLGVYVDDLKKNNWNNHNLPTFSEPSLEQSSFSAKVKLMGIEYKEKLKIERGQEYYNKIRNMNEELVEIGAKDSVSLDTKEFGMITGMEITNKELREFENNYNIENKITNLEKHIEEKFDKHFIEKEKQAENETPKKNKIKEIEEEVEY